MQLWSRVLGAASTVAAGVIWHSYWALIVGILIYRGSRLAQSYIMSSYRPRVTIEAWQRILGFSLWSWGQTMVYQAKERSDSIVIGRLLGAAPVGAFALGLELGSLPTTELVEPLGRALFSGFASLHNASERVSNMFLGAIGVAILLILPAAFGISMIADPAVRLALGDHWLAAVPVVQIMAIGGVTAIFTQTCSNLLNAIGRPHTTFYVSTASLAVKLVALILLVPEYGLPGAAVALVVPNGFDLLSLLWLTLPCIGVSPSRLAACMIRPAIATATMVIVLWQLGMAWTPHFGTEPFGLCQDVFVRAVIGASCYAMALFALWLTAGRPDGAEQFVRETS